MLQMTTLEGMGIQYHPIMTDQDFQQQMLRF